MEYQKMDLRYHLERAKSQLSRVKESLCSCKSWIDQYMRFSIGFKIICVCPMLLYLVIFKAQATIPFDVRPDIDSTTLPSVENAILLGGSLQHWPRESLPDDADWFIDILDLFAGFLYLVHFVGAWVFALGLWFLYRNRRIHDKPIPQPWTFLFCLGLLNLTAVICQICWPTAPPWYVEKYGDSVPSYEMGGDEAGLQNVDSMLGMSLFDGLYGTSPLVFASFPSLHGGWPLIIALTLPGKWKILGFCYAASVWWAAMYLGHHFLTDLIGSLIFSLISFYGGVFVLKRIIVLFPDFSFVHNKGWHKLSKMELHNIKIVQEDLSPIETLPQE